MNFRVAGYNCNDSMSAGRVEQWFPTFYSGVPFLTLEFDPRPMFR